MSKTRPWFRSPAGNPPAGCAALARLLTALLVSAPIASHGQDPGGDDAVPQAVRDVGRRLARMQAATRSGAGRIAVTGCAGAEAVLTSRWAEEVLLGFSRRTGFFGQFAEKDLLSVRVAGTNAAAADEPRHLAVLPGNVLVVRDPMAMDIVEANEALCGLLLRLTVERSAPAGRTPRLPPRWLAVGIARGLYPVTRAEDAERVLEDWQVGGLDPVAVFLGRDLEPRRPGDGAYAALLLRGLLARGEALPFFRRAVERLASGGALSADWAGREAGGDGGSADLESAWDAWLLRQRRTVQIPGRCPPSAARNLQAALLIYPGVYGMPLNAQPQRPISWEELIALRDGRWVRRFCARKAVALQLAAAGRGPQAQEVAAAAVGCLRALGSGADARRLRALADAAGRKADEFFAGFLEAWATESKADRQP